MGPLNSKKSYVCHSLSYVSIIFFWEEVLVFCERRLSQLLTKGIPILLFYHFLTINKHKYKMFLKHWTSYFNDFNNIINIFNLLSFFYIKWSLEELNTK